MNLEKLTDILKKSDGQITEMVEAISKAGYDANSVASKGRLMNFLKCDQEFKKELYDIIMTHFTNVTTFNGKEAFAIKYGTETVGSGVSTVKGFEEIVARDQNNNIPITAADSRIDHNQGERATITELNKTEQIKPPNIGMVDESQIKNIDRGFNKKK